MSKPSPAGLSRRMFLRLTLGGATMATLHGCAPASSAASTDTATGDAPATNATAAESLTTTFLKVGKADAIILTTPRSCVVVDTGTAAKADRLTSALAELGVTRVDALVITHFDQDHVGGAADVIAAVDVGAVYTTYQSKESDEIDAYEAALADAGIVATQVGTTTTFAVDGVTYVLMPPERSAYDEDTSNNSSLVTRVAHGATTLLLAGDIQRERIDELLASGADLACDLIKVPHHGRIEDNTAALVAAASPAYAVITSSKDDPEDDEVLDVLEAADVEVLLTREGTVSATSDGTGLVVTQ